MRYGSVCSGIEAASAAWEPLGWEPVFFSEIEKFPSSVLAKHFPQVPNLGDFTTIGSEHDIDLLVGGTPCQPFSVAGNREGLGDVRGNLALQFCRLAERLRPRWVVWENVPGVLSSNGGRDFGSIVGALADLGYGIAYRVLDAGFFGVPQRRRRVILVANLVGWRCAASVLFDGPRCFRNPDSIRETQEETAPQAEGSIDCYNAEGRTGLPFLTASNLSKTVNNQTPLILQDGRLRRFMPLEIERLFGFPDNWTLVSEKTKDTPRYKALGNSMAVPMMRWLGERIEIADRA